MTVHFNKQTPVDYLGEAYRKVCKIHRQQGAGNILVFVTGQAEVHRLCRKLRKTFPSRQKPMGDCEYNNSDTKTEKRKVGRAVEKHRKGKLKSVKEINLDE